MNASVKLVGGGERRFRVWDRVLLAEGNSRPRVGRLEVGLNVLGTYRNAEERVMVLRHFRVDPESVVVVE